MLNDKRVKINQLNKDYCNNDEEEEDDDGGDDEDDGDDNHDAGLTMWAMVLPLPIIVAITTTTMINLILHNYNDKM